MTTDWIIAIAAIAVALAAVVVLWVARRRRPSDAGETVDHWDARSTRVLGTGERRAYRLLRQAFPAQHVLAKLPLVRFVRMPRRENQASWLRDVGRLTADFVVCDGDFEVLAVVSLNPGDTAPRSARSNKRRDRARRVLQAAGVPLHIWNIDALPGIAEARESIATAHGADIERDEWLAPTTRPEPRDSRPPRGAHAMHAAASTHWEPMPIPPSVRARFSATESSRGMPTLTSAIDDEDGFDPRHDERYDGRHGGRDVGGDTLQPDEVIEMREPPTSTWVDDLDDAAPRQRRRASDRLPPGDPRRSR